MLPSAKWPEDLAEFEFETDDVIPLAELVDSFKALDDLFARHSGNGARLAVAEIRKGSIVALLAPFVPILGPTMTFVSASIDVADFIRRLRDGLNAFAGISSPEVIDREPVDSQIAAEIAALVKPLAGRSGSRLGMSHIKYRSKTEGRTIEFEASFDSTEIDRIAVHAAREIEAMASLKVLSPPSEAPSLFRKVVLTLQQTNTSPAKSKGKTGDRGIIEAVSDKPLAVYFAKTVDDLKAKIVGRSANPFRRPFIVDALVTYEDGEPKSYTVIEVHRAQRARRTKGPPDLLSGI